MEISKETGKEIGKEIVIFPTTKHELIPLLKYCQQFGWRQIFPSTDEDALGHPNDIELSHEFESGLCLRLQIRQAQYSGITQTTTATFHLLAQSSEGYHEVYDFGEFQKGYGNEFKFASDRPVNIVPEVAFLDKVVSAKTQSEVLDGGLWDYINETLVAAMGSNSQMLQALYLAVAVHDWNGFTKRKPFPEDLACSTRESVSKQLIGFGMDGHIAAAAIETIILMARVYGCCDEQLKYIFMSLFQQC